jgi:hypothetical protein
MIVLVVLLAIVALGAVIAALVTRSRLVAQRTKAAATAAELAATSAQLATTSADLEQTRTELATAVEERDHAQARADEAQARADQLAVRSGVDAELLWSFEQARSERTWRHSVALGPETPSVFLGAADPLREALQVELDAAREEVGAVVELEAELPPGISTAGSVLALRAAQELVARAVKVAEETTLQVRPDGHDLLVTVDARDEDGANVTIEPLALPDSPDVAVDDGGVRIRNAVDPAR